MDKVKIKRARREHKEITAKGKALAALGLTSTLAGGAGGLAPKQEQTQIVRTLDKNQRGSATAKIKETLKNIFGPKQAKASDPATERDSVLEQAEQSKEERMRNINEWHDQAVRDADSWLESDTENPDAQRRHQDIEDAYNQEVSSIDNDYNAAIQAANEAYDAAMAALEETPVPVEPVEPVEPEAPNPEPTPEPVEPEHVIPLIGPGPTPAPVEPEPEAPNPEPPPSEPEPEVPIPDFVRPEPVEAAPAYPEEEIPDEPPSTPAPAAVADDFNITASQLNAQHASTVIYSPKVTDSQLDSIHDELAGLISSGQVSTIIPGSVAAYMLGWGDAADAGSVKYVGNQSFIFDGTNWVLEGAVEKYPEKPISPPVEAAPENPAAEATPAAPAPTPSPVVLVPSLQVVNPETSQLTAQSASTLTYSGKVTDQQLESIHDELSGLLTSGQVASITPGSVTAFMLGWGSTADLDDSKTVGDKTYVFNGKNWILQVEVGPSSSSGQVPAEAAPARPSEEVPAEKLPEPLPHQPVEKTPLASQPISVPSLAVDNSGAEQELTAYNATVLPYSSAATEGQMNSIHDKLLRVIADRRIETITPGSVAAYMLGWGDAGREGESRTVEDRTYIFHNGIWELEGGAVPLPALGRELPPEELPHQPAEKSAKILPSIPTAPAPAAVADDFNITASQITAQNASTLLYSSKINDEQLNGIHDELLNLLTSGKIDTILPGSVTA